MRCFNYCKDTNFQANHNYMLTITIVHTVVSTTAKILIFKQITTSLQRFSLPPCCFNYCKDTNFQANHNGLSYTDKETFVVSTTAKILIFKQITTLDSCLSSAEALFQLLQIYEFLSKSQLLIS